MRWYEDVDGEQYLYTDFEPFNANKCLACFDQPDLKSPVLMTVMVPEDWKAISNTTVDSCQNISGDECPDDDPVFDARDKTK
jgi:aminopeptidase N